MSTKPTQYSITFTEATEFGQNSRGSSSATYTVPRKVWYEIIASLKLPRTPADKKAS